jgi:Na+/H+-dicarboxylate symporter
VGLLQMTVLPYLVLSLIAKTARLDVTQARRLGLTALIVLLVFWLVGIVLILLVSAVLPQIAHRCEQLINEESQSPSEIRESTASVVVPLAYPFLHIGKILALLFISFAAWYVGRGLTAGQTTAMAATRAVSSFASPLVSMPYRVMHWMSLKLIVTQVLHGGLRVRWRGLLTATLSVLICSGIAGVASRWYLASTTLAYDLDQRLLSLEVPSPHNDVVVYQSRLDVPQRPLLDGMTLERVKT